MAVSFKYGAEALALLGIAYGLIKWVGRTLRSQVSDTPLEGHRVQALGATANPAAADLLVRQGIVSARQLDGMTPREREFLIATASPQLGASRRTTSAATPAATGARNVSATPARGGRAVQASPPSPAPPAPPRLHLITPSRPPLGVMVHCPACGAPLDREALQRLGATKCERCRRPVSAHIQRGRLTVIIEETPEEADHRRRLDGGP